MDWNSMNEVDGITQIGHALFPKDIAKYVLQWISKTPHCPEFQILLPSTIEKYILVYTLFFYLNNTTTLSFCFLICKSKMDTVKYPMTNRIKYQDL